MKIAIPMRFKKKATNQTIVFVTKLKVPRYILTSCNFCSETEKADCLALVDFLRGLVEFDPNKRWSPLQVFADDTSTFSFLGIIVFVNWNIFQS
jgi:hypothetical protein